VPEIRVPRYGDDDIPSDDPSEHKSKDIDDDDDDDDDDDAGVAARPGLVITKKKEKKGFELGPLARADLPRKIKTKDIISGRAERLLKKLGATELLQNLAGATDRAAVTDAVDAPAIAERPAAKMMPAPVYRTIRSLSFYLPRVGAHL
jgi:hypothetical protein